MTLKSPREHLVFIPCDEVSLAGVVTFPSEPNGLAVLMPWGAGTAPSSGANQLRTRLARRLADIGFHTLRFDYRGVGESSGEYVKPNMARPNTKEIVSACEWLATQDLSRIVLVSNCFGGWSSLLAAPMINGLQGMVVVNSPVRRDHEEVWGGEESWKWWFAKFRKMTLSKIRNANRRALYRKLIAAKAASLVGSGTRDSRFSSAINYLLDRRIPILLIYGAGDFAADIDYELNNGLQAAIEGADPPTRLIKTSERFEGSASLVPQDLLLHEVVLWLRELLLTDLRADESLNR